MPKVQKKSAKTVLRKPSRKKVRQDKNPKALAKRAESEDLSNSPAESGSFEIGSLGDSLAVGYRPSGQLHPQDETLFRAFQANLLSLISHELRTPLTGVLNALSALDSDGSNGGMSASELVSMARRNAQRLHQALTTLLDLASLESGTFHARLREVDLLRVVRTRLDAQAPLFRDAEIEVELASTVNSLVLADPPKLGRVMDLCFESITARILPRSKAVVKALASKVEIKFQLRPESERFWRTAWSQALTGFESGVTSPASAFGGVLQSEKAFLTRTEEGLGSELLVIHQIMRLHSGKFTERHNGTEITIALEFPAMSSEEALRAVLVSRAYAVSHELGSVALALLEVPDGSNAAAFAQKVRASLFRATDAVYVLPQRQQVALVLDDCRPADSLRVMKRLEAELHRKMRHGVAHCPSDGLEPAKLLEIAQERLAALPQSTS